MKNISSSNSTIIYNIIWALILFFLSPTLLLAMSTSQEEAIDRQLGILERPWKISLIRSISRDYLRSQAQPVSGQPFPRQVNEETVGSLSTDMSGSKSPTAPEQGAPRTPSPSCPECDISYPTITPPSGTAPPSPASDFTLDP